MTTAEAIAAMLWADLGGPPALLDRLRFEGEGRWPGRFAVSALAAASVGVAALALAEYADEPTAEVVVDRQLAALWYHFSLRPIRWAMAAEWDSLAGIYRAADNWIRLHTNAPAHRRVAQHVLGPASDRVAMRPLVERWRAADLEDAMIAAGGCAGALRNRAQWLASAPGAALAAEPIVAWREGVEGVALGKAGRAARPLQGIRVLDVTRVLAGPVATRFLAAFGATVLRIDPPDWDEAIAPEVTLGKHCAQLDIGDAAGRERFASLIASADVFVHGLRADALERHGFDAAALQLLRPGLIDVGLNAYGWTSNWRNRRGFDSVVQMTSGIAAALAAAIGGSEPVPMPVAALDQTLGYLSAAAVLRGMSRARASGRGQQASLSLARTAELLCAWPAESDQPEFTDERPEHLDPAIEQTAWGPARRVCFPARILGIEPKWTVPAGRLSRAPPRWPD